jgi:DNA polymerase-3 subunit gamma/tau
MYTVLYRQWRPKNLREVVGQEHVVTTLANALAQGRVGHAYLFAGPRGVGKTTVARILARAVNCKNGVGPEPCDKCVCCQSILSANCLDVIEIDAASNRGIDEIRELREKVRFYPAECRYKVYIIDEVHMLTQEAFNALLKTLEEPPPHVIFILATTEPHRIPLTILSRCQRFDFHRLEPEEILGRLREVLEASGGAASESGLLIIARAADGALRDALSVLDQALALGQGTVSDDTVLSILGIPDRMSISQAVLAMANNDVAGIFSLVDTLLKEGRDLRQFSRDLATRLRDLLLVRSGAKLGLRVSEADMVEMRKEAQLFGPGFIIEALKAITQAESDMRWSSWPRLVLETCLLSLMAKGGKASGQLMAEASASDTKPAASQAKPTAPDMRPGAPDMRPGAPGPKPVQQLEDRPKDEKPADSGVASSAAPAAIPAAVAQPAPDSSSGSSEAPGLNLDAIKQGWETVLDLAKKQKAMRVRAFLQDAKPVAVSGNTIVIVLKYAAHRDHLEVPENKLVLERLFRAYLRQPVQVKLEVAGEDRSSPGDPGDDPLVRGVLEIFGGEIIADKDDSKARWGV